MYGVTNVGPVLAMLGSNDRYQPWVTNVGPGPAVLVPAVLGSPM